MSEEVEGTELEITGQDAAEGFELETADDAVEVQNESPAGSDAERGEEESETADEGAHAEEEEAPEAAKVKSPAEQAAALFGIPDADTTADDILLAQAKRAFGLEAPAVIEAEPEPEEIVEEELEPEIDSLIPDDGRAWYVVHCYSGYENKVRHSIEQRIETMGMQDKIFDVVVPTEEEIEIKDGKRRTVERRVFPGYILVQMLMSEDSWYVVRNTPGVTGFVGMGNEPTPLRPDEVAKIMSRMEAEAPKVKFDFQIGEKVRIGTGPFADFIGTVAAIDADRAKVRVMVSFFGRETPVELDFLHVEKV
jgi:transcriptional antiterminator NusG